MDSKPIREYPIKMDQLETKIDDAVAGYEGGAVMAVGVDNFKYLTRTVLPFAWNYPDRRAVVVLPKEGQGEVICPADWSQAVLDQGWKGVVTVYDENEGMHPGPLVGKIEESLAGLGLERSTIGIDASRVTKGLMDALKEVLPRVTWEPVDHLLEELRIVKTPGEVALIEEASKQADRGIIHALNHLEGAVEVPGYTVAEFTERVRVHICESGGSGVGLLSTNLGPDTQLYYAPQKGRFTDGELFRVDVSSHLRGYWCDIGRMAVTGRPSPEQAAAYRDNMRLKRVAVDMLKPGVASNEVFAQVSRTAEKERIAFWGDVGIGHGVGVSHHEAPYLNLSSSTELRPGMVVALDIFTYGPRKELIHSKDLYLISEEGNRLLSWYKAWDSLYAVTGFRASH